MSARGRGRAVAVAALVGALAFMVGLWLFRATADPGHQDPTFWVSVEGYAADRLMDSVVVLPRAALTSPDAAQPRIFVYFGPTPTACVVLPDGRRGWLSIQQPDEEGRFDFERPASNFWEDDCGFSFWSDDPRIRTPVIEPMILEHP